MAVKMFILVLWVMTPHTVVSGHTNVLKERIACIVRVEVNGDCTSSHSSPVRKYRFC
jgi:hypothetical protein